MFLLVLKNIILEENFTHYQQALNNPEFISLHNLYCGMYHDITNSGLCSLLGRE